MIIFNCEYCGKEVKTYKSRKSKYCSSECCYRDRERKHMKKCKFCGKEFHYKDRKQMFCSKECVWEYQKTLIGEKSPKYNHTELQCEICGKTFSVKQSKVGKQRFCSRECQEIWYSEYRKTPEKTKELAERLIKLLDEGKIKKSLTKPHIKINKMLDELSIKYENEYNVKYYSIDIFLPENNLMIEIMGDYWHSNPTTKYGDAKNEQQQSRIGKDKAKHSYVKNQYGIEILYLWENDINNRIDLCKNLVLEYIYNNGILENYNSFNYNKEFGELHLNDKIIVPKFAS